MARAAAATLRGLVGIAAAGRHRVSASGRGQGAGPRAGAPHFGGRSYRAAASGSGAGAGGRATLGRSSSSYVLPRLQPRRGAAAAAAGRTTLPQRKAAGWLSGGIESEDGMLRCGYSSFKGRRPSMEDRYDIRLTKIDEQAVNLFGVFDGHGGQLAAEYLKEHLFENLMKHPQFLTDTKLAISQTFLKTDTDLLEAVSNPLSDDGSTALAAILVGKHLYVANVGDSRAVLSKGGKAAPVSNDQKPNRKDEWERIKNSGGAITYDGTFRVGGVLAMSRAFGNHLLKKYVIAEPEIQEEEVNSDLEYLVLATDGLWDVVQNEDAISILRAEDGPEAAAVRLTEVAYSELSYDNITCIVVQFHHGV